MLKNLERNWLLRSRVPRSAPKNMKWYNLQGHQTTVRNHMKTHDRLLIVHGTGSGKTLSAAHIAKDYFNENPSKNIIIFITPAAVQEQFKRSVLSVLAGRPGIYFTTYTSLTTFLHKLYVSRRERLQQIMRHAMIIADEAHYITNKSEKARVFETLKHAEKVVLMTGTPIINGNIEDLLPYAQILNPTLTITKQNLGNDYEKYFKCKVSIYTTPENSKDFPKLLKTERFNFPLSNNQLGIVNAKRLNRYEWSKWSGAPPGNRSRKRSGWAFNRALYSYKLFGGGATEPKFEKFLELYTQRPYKTIVFFKEYVTLRKFERFLKAHRIDYRKVTGEEKNKSNIIQRNAPNSKMVYLLTSAAKEGLDFKGVRTVMFMDYPWVPSDYNQIVGRARRFKSHMMLPNNQRNVRVYELAYSHPTKKTLNVRSLNILNTKRTRIAAILDRLRLVSIEQNRCVASPRRPRPNNTSNRLKPRPNRVLVPHKNYAIDPTTATKYHSVAFNVPRNQPIVPKKNKNTMGIENIMRPGTLKRKRST